MPSIFYYILIGIMQGILEWIPISSEGQLILISVEFYNLSTDNALSLAIWLHLGTVLAVLIKYHREWKRILDIRYPDDDGLRSLTIYATIGTAITAFPIRLLLLGTLDNPIISGLLIGIIGFALIFTGYLMRKSENIQGFKSVNKLSKRDKIIIGMAQGLSIIPGVSRSGTTISSFLLLRVDKNDSFKGSFIISVPAVIGAVIIELMLKIVDQTAILSGFSTLGILTSILFAFVVGYLTIGLILDIVNKYDFSIITLVLGVVLIIFLLISL